MARCRRHDSRLGGRPHDRVLAAGGSGELLEADFAVGGNEHADGVASCPRHQRLERPRRLDAERSRRLHADALRCGGVVGIMQREGDAGFGERDGRGRAVRHGQ
jgi:hypothetical protein